MRIWIWFRCNGCKSWVDPPENSSPIFFTEPQDRAKGHCDLHSGPLLSLRADCDQMIGVATVHKRDNADFVSSVPRGIVSQPVQVRSGTTQGICSSLLTSRLDAHAFPSLFILRHARRESLAPPYFLLARARGSMRRLLPRIMSTSSWRRSRASTIAQRGCKYAMAVDATRWSGFGLDARMCRSCSTLVKASCAHRVDT